MSANTTKPAAVAAPVATDISAMIAKAVAEALAAQAATFQAAQAAPAPVAKLLPKAGQSIFPAHKPGKVWNLTLPAGTPVAWTDDAGEHEIILDEPLAITTKFVKGIIVAGDTEAAKPATKAKATAKATGRKARK